MIRLEFSVLGNDIIGINEISSSIGGLGTTLWATLVEILVLLVVFKALSLLGVLGLLGALAVGVLVALESLVVMVIVGMGVVLDKLID